jgi:hypothetical protein
VFFAEGSDSYQVKLKSHAAKEEFPITSKCNTVYGFNSILGLQHVTSYCLLAMDSNCNIFGLNLELKPKVIQLMLPFNTVTFNLKNQLIFLAV